MKRLFFAISTMLLLLTASCGHKNMFILQGTVQNDIDTILILGLDSRFDRVDTIVCQNGEINEASTTKLFGRRALVAPQTAMILHD